MNPFTNHERANYKTTYDVSIRLTVKIETPQILVVSDDATRCDHVSKSLEAFGNFWEYSVCDYESAIVSDSANEADVIIIVAVQRNVFSMCLQVRSKWPGQPVLLLYDPKDTELDSVVTSGADYFLSPDCSANDLIERVLLMCIYRSIERNHANES